MMTTNEWEVLNKCCLNVARKEMRKRGITDQDMMNDLASDILCNCAKYIELCGVKPKYDNGLAAFVQTYGLKPVLLGKQRVFNDQMLNLEGIGFNEDSENWNDILSESDYIDGKIVVKGV